MQERINADVYLIKTILYLVVQQVHLSSLRFIKTHFEIHHLTMLLPPISILSLCQESTLPNSMLSLEWTDVII